MQFIGDDGKFKQPKLDLPKPVKEKIDFPFQELGVKMQKYFGDNEKKRIWPLFHKVPLWKIQEGFNVCEKKGIKNLNYLFGVLKNL